MRSIWTDAAPLPQFEPLQKDISTDVLIIGGGMAGLLCAHELARRGVDYVLVEAQSLCGGVTENTTAKITSQHGLLYHKLLRRFGAARARLYLEAGEAAVESYRKLCAGIDCGFAERDAFVYSLRGKKRLVREVDALRRLGFGAELAESLMLPFPAEGAVRFGAQAQFDPLRFAGAIARGLHIYEHTAVRRLDAHTAQTDGGRITARKIIVATHFPFITTHGFYFVKLCQHRSYVIALEKAPDVGGMYVDEAEGGLSLRNEGGLLLIGGGGHRTGAQGGGWQELESFARRYYPHSPVVRRWATQDCMTLDGVPYIGQYSPLTPDLYVATGFNKWGMSTAMTASGVLADLVTGQENRYARLFSPSRSVLHPRLAVNAGAALLHLLTPARRRCPHMGCALKWNPQERTWDCPCHGSRFTEDGRLIDNPATHGLA